MNMMDIKKGTVVTVKADEEYSYVKPGTQAKRHPALLDDATSVRFVIVSGGIKDVDDVEFGVNDSIFLDADNILEVL